MAKAPSGETKTPVVVALVFFVLTTLALGVLTYMAYSQMAQMEDDRKKAESDKQAAQDLQTAAEEKLLLYKVAMGVESEEDRTNLQNMRKTDEVRKEYNTLMTELRNRVSGAVQAEARKFVGVPGDAFAMQANEVFDWQWPDSGNLAPTPAASLIDRTVAMYAAQQLGQRQVVSEKRELESARASTQKLGEAYQAAKNEYESKLKDIPNQIAALAKKYEGQAAATRDSFASEIKQYIDAKRSFTDEMSQKDLAIRQIEEDLARRTRRVQDLEAQIEADEDPFEFDRPHGQIVRRIRDNLVEINLGSRDNVKPGLKFAVQPSDTPERGMDSRKRNVRNRDGKLEVQIVPKGKIEVIQVLGPNLSQARILQGQETDPIRDPILGGDLLYNSVWRKGQPDHVALFGIFDLTGNGVDDIKRLARELTRMGIVVDAYYDLEKKEWVGEISEKTIYTIQGYVPFKDVRAGEPEAIVAAKATILQGIEDARNEAKERGTKLVRMRDFFPRIGYPVNLDVDERRINEAAARYLKGQLPEGSIPAGDDPFGF